VCGGAEPGAVLNGQLVVMATIDPWVKSVPDLRRAKQCSTSAG
jgi:hypothetical protein